MKAPSHAAFVHQINDGYLAEQKCCIVDGVNFTHNQFIVEEETLQHQLNN